MATGYSNTQIALHWLVVVLLAAQFLLAEGMEEAFDAREHGGAEEAYERTGNSPEAEDENETTGTAQASATLPRGALIHMLLGGAVFLAMAWRLRQRVTRGVPPAPAEDPRWQQRLSRAVHGLFYVLLLSMPIAGAVAWFGPSEAIAEAHEAAATIVLVAVALHVAGAVYGHVIQKSDVLRRMLRPAARE